MVQLQKTAQAELLTACNQNSAKEDELGQLRKQLRHNNQTSAEQAASLHERQKQIDELSQSLRHQIDQSDRLTQELRHQITQSEERIESLVQLQKTAQAELLTACNQTSAKEDELAQLSKQILDINQTSVEQAALLLKRQVQVDDLTMLLQRQEEQITQSNDELQQNTLLLDVETARLNTQLSELQAELAAARNQIVANAEALNEQNRQTAFWHQQVESLQERTEKYTQRITQLELERAEIDMKQKLLDQEIIKAEAQIELIKDVVLREKAF